MNFEIVVQESYHFSLSKREAQALESVLYPVVAESKYYVTLPEDLANFISDFHEKLPTL